MKYPLIVNNTIKTISHEMRKERLRWELFLCIFIKKYICLLLLHTSFNEGALHWLCYNIKSSLVKY